MISWGEDFKHDVRGWQNWRGRLERVMIRRGTDTSFPGEECGKRLSIMPGQALGVFPQLNTPLVMSLIAETTSSMMSTRPCRFCLCLQGGSVFADFDTDDADRVILKRISFDGFGCCTVDDSITKMNLFDSRLLLDAVSSGVLDSTQVEDALRRYFQENTQVIWSDALAEHELL